MTAQKCSVVIPVYQSTSSLRELHARITTVFDTIGRSFEIIMVQDGGDEQTWQIMQSLKKIDSRIKIIRLTRNFGQHNAMICGFTFASGDYVITMDDDLQNPPEAIPTLLQALEERDLDVVYGYPKVKEHSFVRKIGSRIYIKLISFAFKDIRQFRISSFRIIRKKFVDLIKNPLSPHPLVGLLLLEVTDRIGSVEVAHHKRKYGKPTYTFSKLIQHFANGVLYHNNLLLKAIIYLGTTVFCLSLMISALYLAAHIYADIRFSAWHLVILMQFFLFGIILFLMGIMGKYFQETVQEIRRSPPYVIRDKQL